MELWARERATAKLIEKQAREIHTRASLMRCAADVEDGLQCSRDNGHKAKHRHDRDDYETGTPPAAVATQEPAPRRLFVVPGPGTATRVTYEDRDGGPGEAALITEGTYRGLWRGNQGRLYDWCDLLVEHEPLEEA